MEGICAFGVSEKGKGGGNETEIKSQKRRWRIVYAI